MKKTFQIGAIMTKSKATKKIFVLSTSKRSNSRSNLVLDHMVASLTESLGESKTLVVEYYDLHKALKESSTFSSPAGKEMVKAFQTADAWILGTPIYNWQTNPDLLTFLNIAIDSDKIKKFTPLILVAAAGSKTAITCLDGLMRAFTMELDAMVLGKPVVITEDQLTKSGELKVEFEERYMKYLNQLVYLLS